MFDILYWILVIIVWVNCIRVMIKLVRARKSTVPRTCNHDTPQPSPLVLEARKDIDALDVHNCDETQKIYAEYRKQMK